MPSGIDAYRRKSQQKQQQKESFESGPASFTNDFRLQANQYAVLRFLEQGDDLTFATVHRIPVTGKSGRPYYKDYVCLDEHGDGSPCPACQHENRDIAKTSDRGYHNIIWREGPVFQRDDKDRPVKGPDGRYITVDHADQVALWKCSWTVHEQLREKDGKYKGLMSRDWEIKRTGSSMQDTKYHIDPVDPDAGATPMLIADLTLAETKYDLEKLTAPVSFQELAQVLGRGATPDGPQQTMDRSAVLPTADSAFGAGDPQRSSAFQRA